MISHIIEQQKAISAVLGEDHKKNWHKQLTNKEFRIIEVLCTEPEPFFYLDALSGEKSVTVSAIQPVMKPIVDVLTVAKDSVHQRG